MVDSLDVMTHRLWILCFPSWMTAVVAMMIACGDDGSTSAGAEPLCSLRYSAFNSSAKVQATSTYEWRCSSTARLLTGNGVPDHPVTGGQFATPISAQVISESFPLAPVSTGAVTGAAMNVGYAINSVKLDPGTAGTCASTASGTAPGQGCVAINGRDPWKIEALGGAFTFGTDENNAHVQPNGQYHYHGMPEGILTRLNKGEAMTLVAFAGDGFPIYARYGHVDANDASSAIKVITGSWQKKATPDAGRPSVSIFPMGTFTQDYEYVTGSGDLDECNGRTGVTPEFPQGTYHYYVTDTYPYIQRCVKGQLST
jgi:YHYH protein